MSRNCRGDADHDFQPIVLPGVSPLRWVWECGCGALMHRVAANAISAKDLNAMVDSSLRLADHVIVDNQSVKGEKWIIRHAEWIFRPNRFRCIYHLVEDYSFVLVFDYCGHDRILHMIHDTDTYRKLLVGAAVRR